MIIAELAWTLANHLPELLLGLIILYASLALLFAITVVISGRLQARIKTAIDRLTIKVAELTDRSADATHSVSVDAGTIDILNAIERLTAKIDQSAERAVATAQAGGPTPMGADVRTAIERLTEKMEQLAAHPAKMSENASDHYALDEIKAAIDALTREVQQLTASIQKIRKPTAEIERWRRGMQQEMRDVLKELK